MKASDFRSEARSKMTGKWGKAALITLFYCLVSFVIGLIQGLFPESLAWVFSILLLVIEIPLAFGMTIAFLKLYNSEDVKATDFFSLGFKNFSKSWSVFFNMLLKLLLPIILIIVSVLLMGAFTIASAFATGSSSVTGGFAFLLIIGVIMYFVALIWAIVKSYYYALSYVILADRPELTGKEAVSESKKLMTNNRGKLFGLQLSFIGWAILASLTFGIGYLWLLPYIQFSTFAFYKKLSGDDSIEVESKVENDNPINE